MDKVRLAIVGCGTISQLNAPGYLGHEKCEVAALCDSKRERAEARARQWGITPKIYTRYEDVLNDSEIDAVELLTPTPLHAPQIVAGLQAGKHVSCQKPVSTTVAGADQVLEAANKAATKFRTTENFLFYPPIVKAKELMDSGAIGEPSLVRVRTIWGKRITGPGLTIEPDAYTWRRDSQAIPGGMLYDDGWHKNATVIWWLGDPEKVFSMVTRSDDFLYDAPTAAIWKFRGKDCLAEFGYAHASEMPVRTRYYPGDEFFEIIGPKGAIWVTRCTGEMLDMPPVMLLTGNGTTGFNVPMDWIEGFNGSARNFIDSIINDEQPDMDADFSKTVLQTTLAFYESAKAERPVDPRTLGASVKR